jgi:hypothetical protein
MGLLASLAARGCGAVVAQFRGCSGRPNRLARSYHSGDTGDLRAVLAALVQRHPGRMLGAAGFSLGGNVLLKYLGECAEATPLAAAVAVSVPFELARGAARLNSGFSRLYQWHLVASLRAKARAKFATRAGCPVPLAALDGLRDFWTFDDRVTAPLHGFRDVHDYYARSSCRQFLPRIRVPTLVVHAVDDPFLSSDAIPTAAELPPAVTLELHPHGGHVGFVAGRWPWRAEYWLEQRIVGALVERLRVTSDEVE